MFDFEKLEVYKTSKQIVLQSLKLNFRIKAEYADIKDQWRRASLSILLNLAEGVGRVTNADKKRFFTIARSSVFECVAIIDISRDLKLINERDYEELYLGYEKISKMLLGLFRAY